MSRLIQDVRYAFRTFTRAPGFAAVAILVLALGIGANSATFTVVNALLFRPIPGQGEGVVGVFRSEKSKPDSFRAFAYPNYVEVRERADVFDGLAAHTFSMAGMPAGDTTRRIFVELISSNYFETLGVPLAAGRSFLADEERPGANIPVVIASYENWRAAGRDPGFIGSTLKINSIDFTVVGVAPPAFTGTMALVAPEVWMPLGMFDAVVNDFFKNTGKGLADREAGSVIAVGRLKRGLSIDAANARLAALSEQMATSAPENKDQAVTVSPLPRMSTSTSPQTDTGLGIAAAALMGLAGTVLLIACLNLANMLLARGSLRSREIAIRVAIGAARGRIVRQLLTESLLLAIGGAAVGLMLAYWSTSLIVASLARALPLAVVFETKPDFMVMLATSAFVALATLLAGAGPALRLSRRDLITDLKEQSASGSGTKWFSARNGMVVAQLALSLGLLAAGGLFARGALRAAGADPGFTYERAILASLDPSIAQFKEAQSRELYRTVLERLRSTPGIETAAIASSVPFGNVQEGRPVERPGSGNQPRSADPRFRIVGSGYFQSLGLRMLRGREFTASEAESAAAPRVAIIDSVLAAQLFPNEEPIGEWIRFSPRDGDSYGRDNEPMQIVGVAPSMAEELMDPSRDPHIYVPFGRNFRAAMTLHIRTVSADPAAVQAMVETVRRELRAVDSRLPVLELLTFKRFHENSLELWALGAGGRMLMTFGALALGLAIAGVYGVRSYLVSRRTREIGIRMALGAKPHDVFTMVMWESIGLTAAGLACGIPLAMLMGSLLGSILPDVSGFDPLAIVAAPLLLAAASLLASYIPARRATQVDPLSALRAE